MVSGYEISVRKIGTGAVMMGDLLLLCGDAG